MVNVISVVVVRGLCTRLELRADDVGGRARVTMDEERYFEDAEQPEQR